MSTNLDRLAVVLVASRNPLNIGAAARAMSNFGFSDLRVVNPYKVAFREARSAVGASKLLSDAKEYDSVAEAVSDCTLVVGTTAGRNRELQHPLHVLQKGSTLIRKRLARSRVALLFGSERIGLRNEELSHCHWLMHIATRDEHISMNLGQAVAVCLYELTRNEKLTQGLQPEKYEFADAAETERLTGLLLEALHISQYLKPGITNEEKARRLLLRLKVQKRDAAVLAGMLRQIVWKLNSSKK